MLDERRRRVRSRAEQSGLQLLQRIRTGSRHHNPPARRARDRPGAYSRHEPGQHDRRLPAATRAYDSDEALCAETRDEVARQPLAAEEVRGVLLAEGMETLVR